jgi:lysyl-tRNA synthetase class 2
MATKDTSYHQMRKTQVLARKMAGEDVYPHKFNVTKTLKEFRAAYDHIEAGSRQPEVSESIAGRVTLVRGAGKLHFMTIEDGGESMQLMFDLSNFGGDKAAFKSTIDAVNRGDIIGVDGFIGKSHKAELSLMVTRAIVLTPCLHELPKSVYGVKDPVLRVTQRYLDLIVNKDSREPFIVRSKVIKGIRKYLDDRDFLEVSTPILNSRAGGANAKPFKTYHNDLKMDMVLRIAPELFLKMLVVGGLPRVYEIGPQFRNESADQRHNPEFTSCEFYMAYADYSDLIGMCEDMMSSLALDITGSYNVKHTLQTGDILDLDFTPPFKRLDMLDEIQKGVGVTLPTDLTTEDARLFLDGLCVKFDIECGSPRTTARLLDKLCGHFVESQCINPTFIVNHPLIMSPLAKWHRSEPGKSERFELFINGMEYCNAYTELNDPFVQRAAFEEQMKDKAKGDEEAQEVDETFLKALEYGLPPTGGFGVGIDRLTMLLSNRYEIFDVILFPTYKEQHIASH